MQPLSETRLWTLLFVLDKPNSGLHSKDVLQDFSQKKGTANATVVQISRGMEICD
jgi:excinuclease UvrABC ATPase subunit